jgi:glycosyltransferase involved in cell wall biosynthesis
VLSVAVDARQIWELGIGTYVRNLLGGLARIGDAGPGLDLTVLVPPPPWVDTWVDPVARAAGFPGARSAAGENGEGEWRVSPDAVGEEARPTPPLRVRVLEFKTRKQSLAEQVAVPARLLGQRLHLFHAPHYVCPLLVSHPLVVTVHDLIHLLFPEFLGRLRRRAAGLLLAAAIRRARRVIADSRCTADDLQRMLPGVRGKLRVVYPGLAARFHAPPPEAPEVEAYRSAHGLPDRYLLTVGALRPHKNLAVAARAYAASGLAPRVGLVFAGEAPARHAGLPARLTADAGPGARFLGRVADAELPLLYAGATAVLVPSLYEGFGLTAVEAMASGAPVIASTGGSLPEVVGEAGLLVPPDDLDGWQGALRRIAGEPGLREELNGRGRERAGRFGLERLGRETLAVYREAAGD